MGKSISAFYKIFKKIDGDNTIYRAIQYKGKLREGILNLCNDVDKQCEQPLWYYEDWWILESPNERTHTGKIKYIMLTPYEFTNSFYEAHFK